MSIDHVILPESWAEQKQYEQMVREIMSIRARGPEPLAMVQVYGCQQNVADAERMKGMLAEMGFSFTNTPEEADLVLFNTCAIREHAEDRAFGNIGALKPVKRRHPSMIIVLCGCMVQQEHVAERIYKSFPFVDLLFGPHAIHRLPELLYRNLTHGKRVFDQEPLNDTVVEDLPVRRDGDLRAWLPIMYGCNNFCSYCIVPYVRGRERSRRPEKVLEEAKEIVSAGYKDMTLLGQNVNSYGKTLEQPVSFAELLRQIAAIPGDFWIRFMTSHPKDATKEMLDVMANSPKICKHLHLPFQSGSNRVLKQMNRRYTRETYLELVAYAKKVMPGISLTSDVIVGFPGETREDFEETLSLIREVEFTSLYTFIFSPRKGTPAEKMEDPVPAETKSQWFSELLKVQEEIASKRCASMIGNTYRVLVEGVHSETECVGRTEGNMMVEFPAGAEIVGHFAKVKIVSAGNWVLKGRLIELED